MRKTAGRFEAGESSFEATGDPAMAIPAFIGRSRPDARPPDRCGLRRLQRRRPSRVMSVW